MSPVLALAIPLAVALVAWYARAVTRSGAVAAVTVGTLVLLATGWPGAAVLAAFFVPSTLMGRIALRRGRVTDAASERRNARQVLANGGAGAVGALLERLTPGLGVWLLTTSLAAAAADTWATSIGAFSRENPRHLLTGRLVPPGTSGGVSLPGTVGAMAGAAVVAVAGALGGGGARLFGAGLLIGFGGMLVDSMLGATLQERFECAACGQTTERRFHCGAPGRLMRGVRWLDNDAVNLLATTAAAFAGAVAWRALVPG